MVGIVNCALLYETFHMNSRDLSTDFSLAQWRMEKSLPAAGDIPNNYLLRLMDETGIAGYLKEPSCNMSDGVYAGAVNGWTNGKSWSVRPAG